METCTGPHTLVFRRNSGRLAAVLVLLLFLLAAPQTAHGAGEAAVFTVDSPVYQAGGLSRTMDAAPFIAEGRTLVPVRYLAAALGVPDGNIIWNPTRQEITLTKDTLTLVLTIGQTDYTLNGRKTAMDTAPLIRSGRTYLPARYVAEALGYTVGWDPAARSVLVTAAAKPGPRSHAVEISGFRYTPAVLTIQAGDSVTWTNRDSARHTVTGGVLDSPLFGAGESFTFTFDAPGTYGYICTPHPSMTGTVIVQ